jgi:hypothetical protein
MNSETTGNLLNGSNKQLDEYRSMQSKKLQLRLNIFAKAAKDKFGSLDNIKEKLSGPVESQKDIDMINTIINLKTFAVIPVFVDDTQISHFYTIGMWYYWGLPEIVINFDKPISKNIEFVNILINIIHDKLFALFQNKILGTEQNKILGTEQNKILGTEQNKISGTDIIRIDYETELKEIELKIENFDIQFNMHRVDQNEYMDIKTIFLMWFYMYYMDAIINNEGEPKLYPVYQISINNEYYDEACNNIINKLKSHINDSNLDSDSELSTLDEEDDEDE